MRVIGVSSSNDRLLSATFLKAGASDFIYRPFVEEELQCRIALNVETLMQINPNNVPKFKEVAQFLAEDLKKLRRPKSESVRFLRPW